MRLIVTTSRKLTGALEHEALSWARRLQAEFAPRGGGSLLSLASEHGADALLVLSATGPRCEMPKAGVEYFFHPGTAAMRLHNIKAGRGDPMLRAMELRCGDQVLDCTLGRGTDAILISHAVGPGGRVVGLEMVPVLAALAEHGLQHYEARQAELNEAMRRIEVREADYNEFLADAAEDSFDVVYFDPVFAAPIEQSQGMASLRVLAHKAQVTPAALEQASRVARRRVVIKNTARGPVWAQLNITQMVKGGGSRIAYGVVPAA